MPAEGPEPIVAAAVASLRARLNTNIDALNAELGNTPQLGHVADDAIYPGGWSLIKYPCVEVAIADFEISGLTLESVDWNLTTPLIVRGWVRDSKTQIGNLYLRSLRFSTAILRTLIVPGAFGTAELSEDRAIRGAFRFNPELDTRDDVESAALLVFYLDEIDTRA